MPLLALHSVSKSYGALKVTDNITLSVNKGETLGILGPNGAGKTTLFNLISGDASVNAGRIVYDGQDVTALPPHLRCRRGIGEDRRSVPGAQAGHVDQVLDVDRHAVQRTERRTGHDGALGRDGVAAGAFLIHDSEAIQHGLRARDRREHGIQIGDGRELASANQRGGARGGHEQQVISGHGHSPEPRQHSAWRPTTTNFQEFHMAQIQPMGMPLAFQVEQPAFINRA